MLSEYQLFIKEPRQTLVYTKLNPTQHFLFKRILHGLKMYEREEVAKMHWDKKRRVTKVWKRGQHVINELKTIRFLFNKLNHYFVYLLNANWVKRYMKCHLNTCLIIRNKNDS